MRNPSAWVEMYSWRIISIVCRWVAMAFFNSVVPTWFDVLKGDVMLMPTLFPMEKGWSSSERAVFLMSAAELLRTYE